MRKATIAYVFTALFVLASPSHAGTLSGTVHSPSLERDLPVTLHTPDVTPVQPKRTEPPFEKTPEPDAKKPTTPKVVRYPLVIYLKNLPIPRLGTTSDKELIDSYLKRGMLVAEVDYQNQPMGRTGREIFEEYCHLWMSFQGHCWSGGSYPALRMHPDAKREPRTWSGRQKGNLTVDGKEYPINGFAVYVVPEGYELKTAEVPYGYVELLLPSKPKKPVPIVMNRMPSFLRTGYSSEPQVSENDMFCYSFAYDGYAVGSFYCYSEHIANQWQDGLYLPGQKVVRMLRGRKREWRLDGKVGLMGISGSANHVFFTSVRRPGQKSSIDEALSHDPVFAASYHQYLPDWVYRYFPEELETGSAVTLASEMPWYRRGTPEELDRGPYGDLDGRPDAFMCGDTANWRAGLPYVDSQMPPFLFTTSGRCSTVGNRVWSYETWRVADSLKRLGAKQFEVFVNPALEHSFDYTRYDYIKAFFDRHLRGEEKHVSVDPGPKPSYEQRWNATPIASSTTPIDPAEMPKKEDFHVFLLLGQSNMVGIPNAKPEDCQPVDGVLKLRGEASDMLTAQSASPVDWVAAAHPLFETQPAPRHPQNQPVGRFGLGIEFAKTYRDANPGVTVGLVPCGWVGASIDRLSKGSPAYENLICRAKAAEQVGTIRGILWQHGETDVNDSATTEAYEAKLHKLIADLRADLETPDLRFVAGELPEFRDADKKPPRRANVAKLRKTLARLPKTEENTAVVSGKDLKDLNREKTGFPINDKIFLDRESLLELGRRYAKAFDDCQVPTKNNKN